MRMNDFVSAVSRITGETVKGGMDALRVFEKWIGAKHPHLLPENGLRMNFPHAQVAMAAVTTKPPSPFVAVASPAIPSALNIAVPTPAPKPAVKISTEVIVALAQRILGSKLPEGAESGQRELALRCLWQAWLDASLPASLRAEMVDFPDRYWRPAAPTGFERSVNAMRKDSLKAALRKLNP